MFVRLALPDDEDACVDLARRQVEETLPHLDFDEAIARRTFRKYLDTADPTIFVVVDRDRVIGHLMALICGYAFTSGLFTVQEVLFVLPEKRGTRAAALLMREFTRWSDRLGARENIGGNSNKFHSEQTSKFLSRFGFENVGYSMKRVPGLSDERWR